MDRPVDPISEPAAYQRLLLGLLGADEPADAQSGTPDSIRALASEAGDLLRQRPEPSEWSVVEVIGHIWDAEVVAAARYRWILAHDGPRLIGYDQDRWVERLRHADVASPEEEIFAPFQALRTANLALWRRTPESERGRVGQHEERGAESYELTFRLIAGHDRFHLDQARRGLVRLRGR